jgi:hypothetical protein
VNKETTIWTLVIGLAVIGGWFLFQRNTVKDIDAYTKARIEDRDLVNMGRLRGTSEYAVYMVSFKDRLYEFQCNNRRRCALVDS